MHWWLKASYTSSLRPRTLRISSALPSMKEASLLQVFRLDFGAVETQPKLCDFGWISEQLRDVAADQVSAARLSS
jgi:hypothetical protein